MSADHLVPLGDTGWSVWRDAVLRTTGFPASGLDRFGAPDCARAADALLAGDLEDDQFDKEFALAQAAGARTCVALAADPAFREAVAWQSATAMSALDGLLRAGPGAHRNRKRREREALVARYWQRYTAKNETVGFFGPAAWATVDPAAPAITAHVGPTVVRDRQVHLEHWALTAYAHRLAEDPLIRRWLPPALHPHLTLDAANRCVLRPALPPVPVSPAEAAALAACDGRRPAVAVVADLVAGAAVRTEDDGYLLLERLADRDLVTWHGDLPQGPDAEDVLRQLIAGIGDDGPRGRAAAGMTRLDDARRVVVSAAGDADRVTTALARLGQVFTDVTGVPAQRKAGQTYAGRGVCVLETVRDLDVVVGGRLLADLAEPLALLLRAARWLTAALADAYGQALRELYAELADGTPVRLADLWYLAQGALFGAAERPVDRVAGEFVRRWAELFGLDRIHDVPAGEPVVRTAAELAPTAERIFAAAAPGWSAGRLHSPDLQIRAVDADAVARGDYEVVLGELHAAWPTFDCAVFTRWHPDPEALRQALAADLGGHRIRPLFPTDWPRYTGRVAHTLDGPTDRQLGFAAAPGADPDRLLAATSVTVAPDAAGDLVATAPDGHTWPLLEMFSAMLSMHAVDGFKLVGAAPHTPRITVDRLVVARETWRTTVEATGLANVTGERARYLAVRAWRRALELPERVFVKVAAETKPVFVDLTSPIHAGYLCTMLRGARAGAVTISEVLPDTGDNWVADAAGERYFSELRLQLVDPERAR